MDFEFQGTEPCHNFVIVRPRILCYLVGEGWWEILLASNFIEGPFFAL